VDDEIIRRHAEIVRQLTADDGPYALREIERSGRKLRVYLRAARNLSRALDRIAAQSANRDLIAVDHRRWTYGEVFAQARRLAAGLQDRSGVRPGDRVGLVMRNRLEWFIAFVAIVRIGAIAVLFNSRSAADELGFAAADVDCRVVIADEARAETLRRSGATTPIILVADDASRPAIAFTTPFGEVIDGAGRDAEIVDLEPDAPAAILFTSGTTGRAKGAVLTHRNFTNVIANIEFLGAVGTTLAAERAGVSTEVIRRAAPAASALLIFPLFHVSGVVVFLGTMIGGGMLTLMRRWRADHALSLIAANQINAISGPPQAVSDLLDAAGASTPLAGLVQLGAGGQATPPNLASRITQTLPQATQGVGWGMTEVVGAASGHSGAVFQARPSSCGRLSPVMELRVVDDQGRELPTGEVGELWLRGAMVMQGYWRSPAANAEAFEDGWYKTGDIGFIDADGFIYVVDRKKDMVISGGENIYCAEVERVLLSDDAVLEAAMFGVPDERLGELPVAAVTLREGEIRTEEMVKAFVRASLADYKAPATVAFDLSPFPRNAIGKVDKKALRSKYLRQR
jgi:long-chain acyl-CoA synthetase